MSEKNQKPESKPVRPVVPQNTIEKGHKTVPLTKDKK